MMPAFKARPTTVDDPSIWTGANYVDLLDPNPAEFRLVDVARGLSHLARFNGLTPRFYSVAEHSLLCLRIAELDGVDEPSVLRAVLMHDAAEAYLGDVTRPLKALLPDFRRIEERMEAALWHRFDVALPTFKYRVKRYDDMALGTEKAALAHGSGRWAGVPPAYPVPVPRLTCEAAAAAFLAAARSLGIPE